MTATLQQIGPRLHAPPALSTLPSVDAQLQRCQTRPHNQDGMPGMCPSSSKATRWLEPLA